ncbi:hypothetical protein P691DRAFT_802597 [Macrolepiota fuliginosa MF-IS2]|uniref:Allantoin permease n=1 Tax=Macrolepiota fuliginosa MF-IS2 TaxID=1400762 RepID=A0A9P5XA77_9AGAR|nr:hypothetical protein P691DRAFT_802597 [Macrolepiota fuliginosa MF-IS2]
MKNHFPESAAMKTNEFVAFMIFWIIGLPLILLRPERYQIPALFASIIVTAGVFVIFIWALVKQGNIGPLWNDPDISSEVEISGSEVNWTMMWMVTRGIGSWSSGILYQSDFSRYAKRPNDQLWGQVFVVPICFTCANVLGIITTSCARGFYPDEPLLWKLYDLLYAVQTHEGSGARAAVFFGASAFFLSSLSSTIVASAVVGGIDLAALLPQYIDIRRGACVIAIIGVLIQPWRILNTPNSFITALSGYAVFLGPLTGIMLVEYHLVRQRRIKLSHLFIPNSASDYWFWHGLNWRAPVAWVLGVFPNIPGFATSVSPGSVRVNSTWMHVFYMSWFLGVFISGAVWFVLNIALPPPGLREVDDEDYFEAFSSKENSKNSLAHVENSIDKSIENRS